jgi:hypothetical protein
MLMNTILWVLAVVVAVFGVIALLNGSILWGVLLLVIACLIGPGGYSIFRGRGAAR